MVVPVGAVAGSNAAAVRVTSGVASQAVTTSIGFPAASTLPKVGGSGDGLIVRITRVLVVLTQPRLSLDSA